MSRLSELSNVLEAAREHLEPSDQDKQRIRRLLAERLAHGPAEIGEESPSAGSEPSSSSHLEAPDTKGSMSSGPLASPGGASAVGVGWVKLWGAVALSAAIGFGAGYKTARLTAAPSQSATAPTLPLPPPDSGSLPGDEAETASPGNDATSNFAAEAPVPTGFQPPRDANGEPSAESQDIREVHRPAGAGDEVLSSKRSVATRSDRGAPRSTRADALYEELSLLRRAEHAIRVGEPLLALGLLQELDESFPLGNVEGGNVEGGNLKEERAAARAMASCQRSLDGQSRQRAAAFLAAHPASVYAQRVRALCEKRGEE